MSALFDIRGLTVALPRNADRAHAVHELSLSVERGKTLCIVGESGSGKSMTAHAAMGLLPRGVHVAGGSIRLDGQELPLHDERAMQRIRGRDMGMIFQEPMTSLNPIMKVSDQIAEVFAAHGVRAGSAVRRRIEALLEEMGLPDPRRIAASYPHQLSGGQRQRVMIAMALALNPKLLIADEPTTALDVTTQAQILGLIRQLREVHGTAVLFITHDFGVVADIADDVAVLNGGEVVEVGPAGALLGDPQHPYTRRLLQAVPTLVPPPPRDLAGAEAVLSVDRLQKTFGRRSRWFPGRPVVTAVDTVSFGIRRGETLALVGESGSGKSTLARCLVRLVEPDGGRVEVGGLSMLEMSQRRFRHHRGRIQIVFQDPFASLNPRRRVGRIIAEGPEAQGVPRARAMARARELLELVGLPAQAVDRYPHEFSGGQRQRIGIARALALDPDVLIADEAVSALDVSVQARILDLIRDLQTRLGIAILFVTHDLRVAAQVCDRIAVMQHGRIVELEETAHLLANPAHPYTRKLFASIPGRSDRDIAMARAADPPPAATP